MSDEQVKLLKEIPHIKLLNKDSNTIAILHITDYDICVHAKCYFGDTINDAQDTEDLALSLLFADVSFKWDGCTHWRFNGEDFEDDKNASGYYHICGAQNFIEHLVINCFIWKAISEVYIRHKENKEYSKEVFLSECNLGNILEEVLKEYTLEFINI